MSETVIAAQNRGYEAGRYIAAIRNVTKRSHASAVAHALCYGRPLPERPAGLSYMAAQAVEMRLSELYRGANLTGALNGRS